MMDLKAPPLDRTVPIPLYFQLENWLLEQIESGAFAVGESIPTESQLREMFQVSRTTVRQAIYELIRSGWLIRNGKKGTIVSVPNKKRASVHAMEPFHKQILKTGRQPTTQVMEVKILDAREEIARNLGISEGEKVIFIFRRRFADEIAVMTIRNFLPYEKCRFVLDYDLTKESLYEVLSTGQQTKASSVRQIVEAQVPTMEDRKLFCIDSAKAILSFQCTDRNSSDEIVSYSLIRYRGDFVKFEVDVAEGMTDRNFSPPDWSLCKI